MSTFFNDSTETANQDDASSDASSSTEGQKPLLADEGREELDVFDIPQAKKHSQLGVAVLVLIGAALTMNRLPMLLRFHQQKY